MATKAQRQAQREHTEAFRPYQEAEADVKRATNEHNNSANTLSIQEQTKLLNGSVNDIINLRGYIMTAIRHKKRMIELTERLLREFDAYRQYRSTHGFVEGDDTAQIRAINVERLSDLKLDIEFLEKTSKLVLQRMAQKDKETKSEKKENTQMGLEDVDAEKVHEAAVEERKFADLPKLQTGGDIEEERDAQQKYGQFLGAQREHLRGSGLPDRGKMFHRGMNRMVGRGTSYLAAYTGMVHRRRREGSLVLTNDKPLFCSRSDDNFEPGIPGRKFYLLITNKPLRMFRWGVEGDEHADHESSINGGDMREFFALIPAALQAGVITQKWADTLVSDLSGQGPGAVTKKTDARGGFTFWTYDTDQDYYFIDMIRPVLKFHGFAGYTRSRHELSEYLFLNPLDDLQMVREHIMPDSFDEDTFVDDMRDLQWYIDKYEKEAADAKAAAAAPPPAAAAAAAPLAAAAPAAAAARGPLGMDPDRDIYSEILEDINVHGSGKPHTLSVIRKKRRHAPGAEHADVLAVNNRRVSRMRGKGGRMVGGMMAGRRMISAQSMVPENYCLEGAVAFLSHYLPPAVGSDLVRNVMPGMNEREVSQVFSTVLGPPIYYADNNATSANINHNINEGLKMAQRNNLMGYMRTEWRNDRKGRWTHITPFVSDPETSTLAFFEPVQGRAGRDVKFYITHLDANGVRVTENVLMDALFRGYDVYETSALFLSMSIFDAHPKTYPGKADYYNSGRFLSDADDGLYADAEDYIDDEPEYVDNGGGGGGAYDGDFDIGEGSGKPQHMLRGSYFSRGVNR
jgi:hypothetical protein